MKILFLGGTNFVGRHIAEAVIAAGHDITFFNRGVSNASLFREQRHLHGDRNGDVSILARVDAEIVIDTSGYTPDEVAASAIALGAKIQRYIFMSSIDVYDSSLPGIDETFETQRLPEGATTADRHPELYGAHKALSEVRLRNALGDHKVLSVRAGLMVGPYDNTDRFTYWPTRVARGGEILAPIGRHLPIQLIDVRDVAAWIVSAIIKELDGTFNLVGDQGCLTLGEVLDTCQLVAQRHADVSYVSGDFLQANDVGPWVEMPLWLPDLAALGNVRNAKARGHGLHLRPLEETVADILNEFKSRQHNYMLRAGLSPERETALLAAWHRENHAYN